MKPRPAAGALERLQADFQRHVLSGTGPFIDAVRADGIGPAARLSIYRHAYRVRLVDALRDAYGHTLRYLGDERFDAEAREYVQAHPSRRESLRWYGAHFAEWLAMHRPYEPELGELAWLDHLLRNAFDGPDAPVLSLDALGAVAPEAWSRIGLALHPTCARLQLAHNTLAIWQALDAEAVPPPCERLAVATELLVWRRGLQPHFRSLGAFECAAIAGLFAGHGFAAVCAHLAERFSASDVAAEAGKLLRRWVEEGLLSSIEDPARLSAAAT